MLLSWQLRHMPMDIPQLHATVHYRLQIHD